MASTPSLAVLPRVCTVNQLKLWPMPSMLTMMLERLITKRNMKKDLEWYMKWKYCETSVPKRSKVRVSVYSGKRLPSLWVSSALRPACRASLRSGLGSTAASPLLLRSSSARLSRSRPLLRSVLRSEPGGEPASREGEATPEPSRSSGLGVGGEKLRGATSALPLPMGPLDTGLASAARRRWRMRLWSVPLCNSSNSFVRRHSCWITLACQEGGPP